MSAQPSSKSLSSQDTQSQKPQTTFNTYGADLERLFRLRTYPWRSNYSAMRAKSQKEPSVPKKTAASTTPCVRPSPLPGARV